MLKIPVTVMVVRERSMVLGVRITVGGAGGGEGGGGEGRGEGGGGGEATAQIVKPVPVTEPSLVQVTVVPATTCTFVGPVEPEYAASPILMKS